jgi:hypothetical protein
MKTEDTPTKGRVSTAKGNPVANCATCRRSQRERHFVIYDAGNNKFFCNDACEDRRPDREHADSPVDTAGSHAL